MCSRVEFDAYKSDLEYYAVAPKTEINQLKMAETQVIARIFLYKNISDYISLV